MTGMADETNEDIWSLSAAINQQPSFAASMLVPAGSVGAQQAMLDPAIHTWLQPGSVAPWVPDLLGEEWKHPNAVLLIGTALAGFIKGYSRRRHIIDLKYYLAAENWQAFQKVFLSAVVSGDNDHYEELCPLLNHPSRFVVFDLVRCSLVVRGIRSGNDRQDENINTRRPARRAVFAQYAEHPKSKQWTKARLMGSQARVVVALGFTAEYGLVRFFADEMGMRVRDSLSGLVWEQPRLLQPHNWTYGYPGGRSRSLGTRYDPPCWWQIENPVTAKPRWALVPVPHPSSWGNDPSYLQSRKLIAAARREVRNWPT